jgi:hypothetical protein
MPYFITAMIVSAVAIWSLLRMLKLSKQIDLIMTERHAETWDALWKKAWDRSRLEINFAWSRKDKHLQDAELTDVVLRLRLFHAIGVICILAIWVILISSQSR